jgi:hypothetical protein
MAAASCKQVTPAAQPGEHACCSLRQAPRTPQILHYPALYTTASQGASPNHRLPHSARVAGRLHPEKIQHWWTRLS